MRSQCKECGGSQICEHIRRRPQCKDCARSSFQPGQIIDKMRKIDMMVELDILKVKYRVRTKTAELKRILRKARKEKNLPNGNVLTTKKRKRKVAVLSISMNPPNGNASKVVGTIVAKKRSRFEDKEITMIHDFQIAASSYVQV